MSTTTITTVQVYLYSQEEPIEFKESWFYLEKNELNDDSTGAFIDINNQFIRKSDIKKILTTKKEIEAVGEEEKDNETKKLDKSYTYSSLAEFNEHWEDCEEPKGMQWVDVLGANDGRVVIQYSNEEEAEKAVEKLKAWQRLEDKGFRFTGLGVEHYEIDDIKYKMEEPPTTHDCQEMKDLDLLFGGEE